MTQGILCDPSAFDVHHPLVQELEQFADRSPIVSSLRQAIVQLSIHVVDHRV